MKSNEKLGKHGYGDGGGHIKKHFFFVLAYLLIQCPVQLWSVPECGLQPSVSLNFVLATSHIRKNGNLLDMLKTRTFPKNMSVK